MSDDCCFSPNQSNSWTDWQQAQPQSILDLVANATIGGATGTSINSSTYANQTWIATPFTINASPTCSALGTDNIQNVADAAQWNFQNQTANLSATTPIPLQKVLFMRTGTDWQMNIGISMGGSTYTEIQLGLLPNAGTRGDAQGTYPVIDWTGSFTGNVTLGVTFKASGSYILGLWAKSGSNFSMMELVCNVIPDEKPSQQQVGLPQLSVAGLIPGGNNGGGPNTPLPGAMSWFDIFTLFTTEVCGTITISTIILAPTPLGGSDTIGCNQIVHTNVGWSTGHPPCVCTM